jgi:hypothetical protein
MVATILALAVVVLAGVGVILFALRLRAGWRHDRLQERKLALWTSGVFIAMVLLIIANPVTNRVTRFILAIAAFCGLLAMVTSVIDYRRVADRERHQQSYPERSGRRF